MAEKPTYEELEQRVKELEKTVLKCNPAEEALRDSNKKLTALLQSSPMAIIAIDSDGNVTFWNAAAEKMFGWKEKEAIGRFLPFVPVRVKSEHHALRNRVLSGEVFHDVEALRQKKDGSDIYISISTVPLKDSTGSISGIMSIIVDITERKKTEEALRKSQQIIEGIINAIPVRVFWKDNNLVYLGCNALFAHDAGLADPKDIIGKDDYQMVWRDQAELYRGDDRQVIESGDSKLLIEESQTTPEGNTITLLTSKIPLRSTTGEISGVLGTYVDITERKQAEEALKISRENLLEEHNQRKILSKRLIDLLEKDRHYIAMELHDNIGQILISLKIYLEIIDYKLESTDTELRSLIKDARKRAKQAIEDLEIIAHGLMPSILDALGLVSSLHTLFDEFREHTDIKIDFFTRNIRKRFDQEKELAIYRIVQEALNNIIKHAEAKNVYVNLLKKGKMLSLSMEDDGVGFDQDKAMKISKGKGPLGLVIMQERAMQLDGELTIESKIGKGTHLLAEIPI